MAGLAMVATRDAHRPDSVVQAIPFSALSPAQQRLIVALVDAAEQAQRKEKAAASGGETATAGAEVRGHVATSAP